MINVNLQIRRAVEQDRDQISNLIFFESNSHRHLDWYSPLEWIGSPNYWVREESGRITAAFACPEDPPHVAWIRFFGFHQSLSAYEAWPSLWEMACGEMTRAGISTKVATIVVKQWFQSLLLSSGFQLVQDIVLLELKKKDFEKNSLPHGIRIRPMLDADLPLVAQVDLAAFGPFWHNTEPALRRASDQGVNATVAEDDSGMIGYQLSTQNPLGAHLARLAVRPEAQGRGVGFALVSHLIESLGAGQLNRLSVNTQADNTASLALYKKLGFVLTGERFPVLAYPIGPDG
jgi:ribosomal protein S18 acetylase RimI-like enzyme